jgi:hypothetical protein
MVQPCIDAIDAYYQEDYNQEINLPHPITWKGNATAPASAIVKAHHLEWFIDPADED